MAEYTIEKVDIKPKKSGEKNNKKWSFTPVGVRIAGEWHSGAINDDKDLETLKEGNKVDLILYTNDGGYKSFKLPKAADKQTERLDEAAKVIQDMANRLDELEKKLDKLYNSPKIKEMLYF